MVVFAALSPRAAANAIDSASDGVVRTNHTRWLVTTFNVAGTWIPLGAIVLVAFTFVSAVHTSTGG